MREQRHSRAWEIGRRKRSIHTPAIRKRKANEQATRPAGRAGIDLRAQPSAKRSVSARMPQRKQLSTNISQPLPGQRIATGLAQRRGRRLPVRAIALAWASLLVVGAIVWVLTGAQWQVRHVNVEGTSDPTIIHAIDALPLTGCNIFRCDTTHAAQLVAMLPTIAHATVRADYPDGLIVSVVLRTPALLWHTSDGTYVVASDGMVLGTPESDPLYARLALPGVADDTAIAFGGQRVAAGTKIAPLDVNMAGQLLNGIVQALGSGWTLQLTGDDGFAAVNAQGQRIVFGRPTDAAQATSAQTGSIAVLGSAPTTAAVTHGVATQLAEAHTLLTLLTHQGQTAMLIDLRWGAYPYYRLNG